MKDSPVHEPCLEQTPFCFGQEPHCGGWASWLRSAVRRGIVTLLCASVLLGTAGAEMDLRFNTVGRWEPATAGEALNLKNVELLQQGGWTMVLLRWPADEKTQAFADACGRAGITPVAELGQVGSLSAARAAAAAARSAGFDGIALEAGGVFGEAEPLRDFVRELRGYDVIVFLDEQQIGWDLGGAHAVFAGGLWPGIRSPPNVPGRGIEVATASREPWLDGNTFLLGYLRGMFPDRAAVVGYRPNAAAGVSGGRAVPYASVEIGLAEAAAAGGNAVLSLPEDYREALLKGDSRALEAWQSLGETARFLQRHAATLEAPSRSRIAVAAGSLAESGEIVNLLYRRSVFPVVHPLRGLPVIDPSRFRALVVANVGQPGKVELRRISGYVRAGGLLVASPADRETPKWWLWSEAVKTRSDRDRDHYEFGNGRIVAYHEPILDPSEFALDVIDLVGVGTRDLRLWNALTVVGLARGEARSRKAVMILINYDEAPVEREFPARMEGVFRRATIMEPGRDPRTLEAAKRGESTEVSVDGFARIALIELR